MKLDFSLPEFTRIVWTSPRAREVWEPRIQAISQAWIKIERAAALKRTKFVTLQSCTPDEQISLSQWATRNGLACITLDRQGASQVYSNATVPFQPGKPWNYRIAIGTGDSVNSFLEFYRGNNNIAMGLLLGFPMCCCEFFQNYWVEQGYRDLTPVMENENEGKYHECNVFLRHLGVRAVSHLPCSFNCLGTVAVGQSLISIGVDLGFTNEMEWLEDILHWPIRWSSLHGIAIVTTPVVKIISSTTALAEKMVIDINSDRYPEEGATGTEFPFKSVRHISFQEFDNFTDNGFTSEKGQREAHNILLELASKADFTQAKVLDLGCGNGLLLRKVVKNIPWMIPCGVECDEDRFASASRRLKDSSIFNCSIFDDHYWDGPYGLALISTARFNDVSDEAVGKVLTRLHDHCEYVIFYDYGNSKGFVIPGFFDVVCTVSGGVAKGTLVKSRKESACLA